MKFNFKKGFKDLEFCSNVDCGGIFINTGKRFCVKLLLEWVSLPLSMALWNEEAEARQSCFIIIVGSFLFWLKTQILLLLLNFRLRLWETQVVVSLFQALSFQYSKCFAVSYCRNKPAQQTDLQYFLRVNVLCGFCSCVNRASKWHIQFHLGSLF